MRARTISVVSSLVVLALGALRCGSDEGRTADPVDAGSDGTSDSSADTEAPDADAGDGGPTPFLVPRPPYAYPSADPDVCHVPVAKKLELQKYLDDEGGLCPSHKVRLDGADYKTGGLDHVTVRSDYEIYGLPGTGENGAPPPTTVPRVVIAGGTERAVLSTLRVDIEFEPSAAPTRHNLIRRIEYGSLKAGPGAVLESNLILGLSWTHVDIDTSAGGWTRYNRFIYGRSQTDQVMHFRLVGDPDKHSYANTVLWYQTQFAAGSGLYIKDQGDISLLDVGGEVWANGLNGVKSEQHKQSAMLELDSTPGSKPAVARVLNVNGGNILGYKTGMLEANVDELTAFGLSQAGPMGSPRLVLRGNNKRFLGVHQSMGDLVIGPYEPSPWATEDTTSAVIRDESTDRQLRLLDNHIEAPDRKLYVDDVEATSAIPPAAQALVKQMIAPTGRSGEPWERPTFGAPPDPTGPSWDADLASKPDSSDYIQSLIDGPEIGYLPAGTYYIAKPLRIKSGQGLRGAGMSETAIVAKSKDIDLVVGADGISFPGVFKDGIDVAYATSVSMYLMDLTLQGGRNGIYHAKEIAGDLTQHTHMQISHVVFRDMEDSGIFIDRVYAWDTNLLDQIHFVHCKQAAVKQRAEQHSGEAPGLGYMDKNFFYESQFIGSAIALDQQGYRASGGNVYLSCLFQDNTVAVAKQVAHSADLFASSDFVGNGGDSATPMISNNGWVDVVSCSFANNPATVFFHGLFDIEGSTFEGAPTARLFDEGQGTNYAFMANNACGIPLGSGISQGFLTNNAYSPADTLYSEHTHFVRNKEILTIVPGAASSVGPQLLWGSRF